MGWDTVSFSLQKTYENNTLYNTWLNRVKNGNKTEFKQFLLSSDENLQLFAKHFDDYQEGDMFVKESVVELEDGRLLCFDADQAQAYILNFEDINKNHDHISMTVFKPEDPSLSYDKQIESLIKQIRVKVGTDKFKAKDGTKLDTEYITANILSSKSLNLYQEAIGLINSKTDETNSIDTKNLNKIYYKNLSQITSEDEEKDYYKTLLTTLGVTIDNDANIVDNTKIIQNINNIIGQISKNLNPTTLTLANQNRLNLMEIFRKLSISEITLIEKLNPGLLSTIGEFIGTYQSVTYTDKYGHSSSTSQVITWADIMKEKAQMKDDPLAYLRYEDRPEKVKVDGDTLKCIIGGKVHTKTLDNEKHTATIDKTGVTYTFDKSGELISVQGGRADAANQLATNQVNETKSAIEVSNYIENTQSQGVSDSTINGYIDDFKKYFSFSNWGEDKMTCSNPDEALMFLAELRDPEVAFKLLSDSNVQKALQLVGKKKGTLAGGKGQTPEMYYIGSDNDIGKDSNGNIATTNMSLTVSNVATHLNIMTELYKNSRVSAEGQKVVGDEERIAEQKAINSIQNMLSGLIDGENLTYDKGYEAGLGITAASVGTVGGVAAVGGGITKAVIKKFIEKEALDLYLNKQRKINAFNKIVNPSNTTKAQFTEVTKNANSQAQKMLNKIEKSKLYTKSASTTAKFGGAVAGAAIGGYLGYQGAELLINSSPERYTNSDGTFATTKANCVKGGLTVGGAIIGGAAGWCIAAGTLAAIGPIGWGILGAAATVAVGFGLLSHFTNWWKK